MIKTPADVMVWCLHRDSKSAEARLAYSPHGYQLQLVVAGDVVFACLFTRALGVGPLHALAALARLKMEQQGWSPAPDTAAQFAD